jgi:asparaginyl-tRNA synthetase
LFLKLGFADLYDIMDLSESYIKMAINYILENNKNDLIYLQTNVKKDLISLLNSIVNTPFKRITYTEAIDKLVGVSQFKKNMFIEKVVWGIALGSEHENYLTNFYNAPVILYNFPNRIKNFYMRRKDEETVSAMEVILPKIGKLVGGSEREERYDVLKESILKTFGNESYKYDSYLELRKFGTVPHSGFGLLFDRLVMLITGVDNTKDAIPYPRYNNHAEF